MTVLHVVLLLIIDDWQTTCTFTKCTADYIWWHNTSYDPQYLQTRWTCTLSRALTKSFWMLCIDTEATLSPVTSCNCRRLRMMILYSWRLRTSLNLEKPVDKMYWTSLAVVTSVCRVVSSASEDSRRFYLVVSNPCVSNCWVIVELRLPLVQRVLLKM